ncbi:MAG: hypothetical protein ABI461_15445, partial [Polyangiaceae bacterium]
MSEQKFIAAPANGASAESDDLDVRIEEDMTDPTPPVMPVADVVVLPSDEGGNGPTTSREDGAIQSARDQMIESESTKTRRARPKKMALRIPDDEVARPSERAPAAAPASVTYVEEPAPISSQRPQIAPSRIIAINPPSNPAPELEPVIETHGQAAISAQQRAALEDHDSIHDAPTRHDISDIDPGDTLDSADRLTPDPITSPSPKLAAANAAELGWELSSPALPTEPRIPAAAPVSPAAVEPKFDPDATLRARTAEILAELPSDDAVDVQVDADESAPSIAPASDPPEIGADDLVSVESMPVIRKHRSAPPGAPPVPALAYQSGEQLAQTPNGAAAVLDQAPPPVVIVPPASPTGAPAVATPSAAPTNVSA